jgi:hypothetical protein
VCAIKRPERSDRRCDRQTCESTESGARAAGVKDGGWNLSREVEYAC